MEQVAHAHRHGGHVHSHASDGPHRHLRRPARARPLRAQDLAGQHRHRDSIDREDEHAHESRHDHDSHVDHAHDDADGHAHSHGLVDDSIKRSREGVRAVSLSLGVLALTTAAQALVFAASGSVALLADLIHNGGDALTALPLGLAFTLRSRRAEGYAGLAVVAAIFASAVVAGVVAVQRLIHPATPHDLFLLSAAGAIGFAGNWLAARIRGSAGRRLQSAALVADADHARADAYVSLAVVASAVSVALGAWVGDPLIGLAITLVILRITWSSWLTVRAASRDGASRRR